MAAATLNPAIDKLDESSILYDLYTRLYDGMSAANKVDAPACVTMPPCEKNEDGTDKIDEDGALSIELKGDNMGILIGKRGQTLDSLQYLVSLVANKESSQYYRVKLDTENYRERRKATLESLAKNIAYKVKRTKKSFPLEPMNPYERRIIHSALQNDKYVVTKSEGEEPFRHVVICMKK